MGTLKLNTTSGGSLSIQAADGASDNTVTLPAVSGANIITSADSGTVTQGMIGSGVAGSGPAFSAYMGSNQSVTQSTATKCVFDTVVFDTNSNFDNTTNYRFTPTVAGYYQINASVYWTSFFADQKQTWISLYKNGSAYKYGSVQNSSGTNDNLAPSISQLVYMNGSTDYLEIYTRQGDTTSKNLFGSSLWSWFTGHLVRAA